MAAILKQLFSKYLIITNTVTSGTLLGLGDVITQNLEIEYASRMGNTSHDYDVRRTGNYTVESSLFSLIQLNMAQSFKSLEACWLSTNIHPPRNKTISQYQL